MNIVALSGGTGWHVQDLLRAAAKAGHTLTACSWRDLVGPVMRGAPLAKAGDVVLDHVDAVLLRTMPPGSLEQIVFRMDLMQRLEEAGTAMFNRPRAIEVSVDKYLALARMEAAGIPVPPTIVCQRLADARVAFEQLGRDVVIKPLFGSEGFGMTRVTDTDAADRVFAAVERIGGVIYLQKFIPHGNTGGSAGCDLRLFVLGDRVIAAMRRTSNGWKTNVAKGGIAETIEPDPSIASLAIRAASACLADIAGVDIVLDAGGAPYVLEVNAVPGWRALSAATGVDVAAAVLDFIAKRAASRGRA